MIDFIQYKKIIVLINNIDLENTITISKDIFLRKTTKDEIEFSKSLYANKLFDEKSDNIYSSSCFEVNISSELIEDLAKSYPKAFLNKHAVNDWKELPEDTIEANFYDDLKLYIELLVLAFKICRTTDCFITGFIGINKTDESKEIIDNEFEPAFCNPIYKCNQEDIEIIIKIWNIFINEIFYLNNNSNKNNGWWYLSCERFNKSFYSKTTSEELIELIISLESLLSAPDESGEIQYRLSMRTSLFMYLINKVNPFEVQALIKELYKARSKIVHGGTNEKNFEWSKFKFNNNNIYYYMAIDTFRECLRSMIFYTIYFYGKKPKKEFIDFLDASWCDIGVSKSLIVNDRIYVRIKNSE